MENDPHCYYCGCEVIYFTLKNHEKMPPNFATLEHINSLNQSRPRPRLGTIVLACNACNEKRGAEEEKQLGIEVLHVKSRMHERNCKNGVYVFPTVYDVSIWPPDHECINSATWALSVVYKGDNRWAVIRGTGSSNGTCMSRDGEWSFDSQLHDKSWLFKYRFTRRTALEIAREWAPKMVINGMTAMEALSQDDCVFS